MTLWHTNRSKFDLVQNIKNRVKFRKICMESLNKKVVVSRRQFHFHNKGFALSLVLKVRVLKLGNDLFNSWKTTFHDKLKELKKVTSL